MRTSDSEPAESRIGTNVVQVTDPVRSPPVRQTVRVAAAFIDLSGLDPQLVVGATALLVLVQTGLVIGFLVPAGKAAVLSGVLAGLGEVSLVLTWTGLVLAAIVGAGVGYEIGRSQGDRVLAHRWLGRHEARIDRGRDLVQRRAAFAIVGGRVVAVLRATTPALAGAVGVSRRTFLLWNIVGGLLWGSVFVGLGYVGATSATESLDRFGSGPVIVAGAAIALVALAGWAWSRRSRAAGLAQESAHSSW